MRSKQRVVRLNEAGLRRLVRGMLNEIAPTPEARPRLPRGREGWQQKIDDWRRAYLNAQDAGLDDRSLESEFAPRLMQIMAPLVAQLPLGDGSGPPPAIKGIVMGYDFELEITVEYFQGGKPRSIPDLDPESILERAFNP